MKQPAAAGLLLISATLHGQPLSNVSDWTDQHVVFTETKDFFKKLRQEREPRYWRQKFRRELKKSADKKGPKDAVAAVRDWSFSLGAAATHSVSNAPAKFTFNVNATPSCTNDFVVIGTARAGSTTQPTIVGLNNLYSNPSGTGFCSGTGPKVLFAYNLSGATVRAAPALSLDGKKVAFVDTAGVMHVLTWQAGDGTMSAPVVPGTGNSAVDVKLTFSGTASTSPYIDYSSDAAYGSTLDAKIYKVTGVFNGTPTVVSSGGWPISVPANASTVVLDYSTRRLFFTVASSTVSASLHYIDDSGATATLASASFNYGGANLSPGPPIVDSTNQRVFVYTYKSPAGTNAVVGQADLNLGNQVLVNIGANASLGPAGVDFNNAYYSGDSAGAMVYAAGNDGANKVPALYALKFNSAFKMNTSVSNGPLRLATNVAGLESSPITTFYNSTLSKDFLFIGVTGSCSTAVTSGCIRSIDITNGFPAPVAAVNTTILAASGGTGAIVIDNNSSLAEAASVYYLQRSVNTLVKATQLNLN